MKKYYVEDLWINKPIPGRAQVPYIYSEEFSFLLNFISLCNDKKIMEEGGREYYLIDEDLFSEFKSIIKKGRAMNDQISSQMAEAQDILAAEVLDASQDVPQADTEGKEAFVQTKENIGEETDDTRVLN
jgi:hypothetical protein